MLGTRQWPKAVRRLLPKLRCSFCGQSADDVARLVSGASAYICDACVAECVAILDKYGGRVGGAGPEH